MKQTAHIQIGVILDRVEGEDGIRTRVVVFDDHSATMTTFGNEQSASAIESAVANVRARLLAEVTR